MQTRRRTATASDPQFNGPGREPKGKQFDDGAGAPKGRNMNIKKKSIGKRIRQDWAARGENLNWGGEEVGK